MLTGVIGTLIMVVFAAKAPLGILAIPLGVLLGLGARAGTSRLLVAHRIKTMRPFLSTTIGELPSPPLDGPSQSSAPSTILPDA